MIETQRFPTTDITSTELDRSGFFWFEGEPIALIKKDFSVQLLLPFDLLRKYPHYSASFNGFIEISFNIVWFSPDFVCDIIRAWAERFFCAQNRLFQKSLGRARH